MDIAEIKQEADKLRSIVDGAVSDFISKTGLSPQVEIHVSSTQTNCGSMHSVSVEVKVKIS